MNVFLKFIGICLLLFMVSCSQEILNDNNLDTDIVQEQFDENLEVRGLERVKESDLECTEDVCLRKFLICVDPSEECGSIGSLKLWWYCDNGTFGGEVIIPLDEFSCRHVDLPADRQIFTTILGGIHACETYVFISPSGVECNNNPDKPSATGFTITWFDTNQIRLNLDHCRSC